MSTAFRIETGVPGYPIHVEALDGVLIERNGAGSVVAHVYPYGLEAPHEDEPLSERVARLTAELKEAKAALRKAKTHECPGCERCAPRAAGRRS